MRRKTVDELLKDVVTPDMRDAPWYRFVEEIRTLRASDEYRWAEELLAGIQATVERTERITPWQQRAVDVIRAQERTPSRVFDVIGRYRRWR